MGKQLLKATEVCPQAMTREAGSVIPYIVSKVQQLHRKQAAFHHKCGSGKRTPMRRLGRAIRDMGGETDCGLANGTRQ